MERRALDIEINSDKHLKDVYAVVSIHDNTSNQIYPIDQFQFYGRMAPTTNGISLWNSAQVSY